MTNDELRALADALEPMAKAPRFEDMNVPAFCRWLRACADAKPVAWVDVTDSYEGPYIFRGKELLPAGRHDLYTHPAPAAPAGYKLVPVEPTPEMLQAGANVMEPNGIGWYDADISRAEYRAMLAAAPAVPQAEPASIGKPGFVQQIETTRESIKAWPQWMQDASVETGATMPTQQAEPKVAASFYTEDAELIGTTGAPIKKVEVEDDGSIHVFIDHWPQPEQPIDLDTVAMQQMRQAAAESTWMPSEYTSNDWIADVCRWLRDGPPAAAPQAEPDDDDDVLVLGEPDILTPEDIRRLVPQAEPKREPLTDEQIDAALQSDPAMVLALMSGEMTVGEFKSALRRLARTVERAHEIGGSDAE